MLSLTAGLATAQGSQLDQRSDTSPFKRGKVRIAIHGGWGSAYAGDYLIIGIGAAYYLLDGLEAGLDFEAWLLSNPNLYRVSPQVRYVYDRADLQLKPYGGFLYRRTFVQDRDDQNSLGLRGGAFYRSRKGTFVGAGIVYESYLDCDSRYLDCSSVYPEITVMLRF
jgi:hypothetical protein